MSKLLDLSDSCDLLTSSRITDQAKGLNGLKILLDNEKLRLSLNQSHERKELPNWNTIFSAISENLNKECDSFSKSYASWTDTSRRNKVKKLDDLFLFAKKFIRIANNGYTKLKLSAFLNFLVGLWSEKIFIDNFGISILNIVHDNILHDRKSCGDLSNEVVSNLFEICQQELTNSDEKRKFTVSTVFRLLTNIVVKKFDFPNFLGLHKVFLESMKTLLHVKTSGLYENIIAAVNVFIKWCAITHHAWCCDFGEECMDIILKIWRESTGNLLDNSTLLGHVVEFCSTQITLHHPKMATSTSLGSYVKSYATWSTQLYSILIAADLQLAKQQSGTQYRLKEDIVCRLDTRCLKLAGDAFCAIHCLAKEGSFVLPKTIKASNSFVKHIDFYDLKSVTSCFTVNRNRKIADSVKPWFAIMNFLLKYHEDIFDTSVLRSMIVNLHRLIMNTNFDSFGSLGVEFMQNTIELLTVKDNISSTSFRELSSIWKDCWNIATSCLSAFTNKSMVLSSLNFLTCLIELDCSVGENFFVSTGVSKTIQNFWSAVYLHVPPSRASIHLAVTYARKYGLKCNKNENDVFYTTLQTTPTNVEFADCSGYKDTLETNPLKIMLLHWLLGFKEEILTEKNVSQSRRSGHLTQMGSRSANEPKTLMLPNILLKDDEISELNEICSDLLSNISYKDSVDSARFFDSQASGDDLTQIVATFLQPDHVTSFKYFNFKSLPWLVNGNQNLDSMGQRNLPLDVPIMETIFGILSTMLDLIRERVVDASMENDCSTFAKLCPLFLVFSSTAGNFLYTCWKNDRLSLKFFESWLEKVLQFTARTLQFLKMDETVMNGSFFGDLSENFQKFLKVFFRLESVIEKGIFHKAKDHLRTPFLSLFEIVLLKVRKLVKQDDIVEEESSPDSHDETLGLTQTSSSSSTLSRGYKRRKYSEDSGPPSKQKRYSTSVNLPSNAASTEPCFNSFSQDHDLAVLMRFLFTVCSHFCEYDAVKDVLHLVSELDPYRLDEVKILFTILDQIPSICSLLTVQDVDGVLDVFKAVFGAWYKDQDISMTFMLILAKILEALSSREDKSLFKEILKRTDDLISIFWKFALAGKGSHLTKIGISACLYATMRYDSCGQDSPEIDKILQLLSDNHDNVRLITVFLLGRTITCHQQNLTLGRLQMEVLSFTSKISEQLSTASGGEFSKIFLGLSTCLHSICAAVFRSSDVNEGDAHYLLCCIESVLHKYKEVSADHDGKNGIVSRCISCMSNMAISSVCHYSGTDNAFHLDYIKRHVKKIFYKWLVKKEGSLDNKMKSFPYHLFGFASLEAFCSCHQKDAFSAIFWSVSKSKELKEAFTKYFKTPNASEQKVDDLKTAFKMFMPGILDLLQPGDTFPSDKSRIFDECFQKQKSLIDMVYQCQGQLIVDFFIKFETELCKSPAVSQGNFKTSFLKLTHFITAADKKSKIAMEDNLNGLLAGLIFGNTHSYHTCVDAFVQFRRHFERSWYAHEYLNCVRAYHKFTSMLLKSGEIPEKLIAYFVSDMISVISQHSVDWEKKLMKADSTNDKVSVARSVIVFTMLLVELCSFLKQFKAVTKKTLEMWRTSVPIFNLVLTLKSFCHSLEEHGLERIRLELDQALQRLSDLVLSFSDVEVFHKIHSFMEASDDISIEAHLEVFENSYAVFHELGLIYERNPIIDSVCKTLAVKMKSFAKQMGAATEKKLIDCALLMIKMAKRCHSLNYGVIDSIVAIYSSASQLPQAGEFAPDSKDFIATEKAELTDALLILFRAVRSKSSQVCYTASVALRSLFHLPDVKSKLPSISSSDSLIGSMQVAFDKSVGGLSGNTPLGVDQLSLVLDNLKLTGERKSDMWICCLASSLVDFCSNQVLRTLKSVCSQFTDLSAWALRHVIHDILVNDPTQKATKALSEYLRTCFKTFLESPDGQEYEIQSLLDVIQFLRSQNISEISVNFQRRNKSGNEKLTTFNNNFWLEINYLHASQVAALCNRPCMAVMFAEIWKESTEESYTSPSVPSSCRSLSKLLVKVENDNLCKNVQSEGMLDESLSVRETREKILISAYCSLEDVDSLYGLRKDSTNDMELMMHIHHKECNWLEALESYNSQMQKAPSTPIARKLISTLHCSGLDHIVATYNMNIKEAGDATSHDDWLKLRSYEAASQITKWGDMSSKYAKADISSQPRQSALNLCFSHLLNRHPAFLSLTKKITKEIFAAVPEEISKLTMFGTKVLGSVSELLVVKDLLSADALISHNAAVITDRVCEALSVSPLVSSDSSLLSSYSCVELIVSSRNAIAEVLSKLGKYSNCKLAPSRVIRQNASLLIDQAARHKREKLSLRMISHEKETISCQIEAQHHGKRFDLFALELKEVQLLWDVGRKTEAILSLVKLQDNIQDSLDTVDSSHQLQLRYLLATILQFRGKWLYDMKMDGRSSIMEKYFSKSVNIACGLKKTVIEGDAVVSNFQIKQLCVSGYKTLGKFADAQYREIIEYMTSKEFEHKRTLVREAQQEMEKAKSKAQAGQNAKYYVLLQKNFKLDHKEFTNILETKEKFLLCAVENYVKCLSLTDENDILMYRICALWFENTQSTSLPGLMRCACSELQTYKFVDICYQLSARLNIKSTDKIFQATLEKLLKSMALEHPHHVLPVLFALASAHRDNDLLKIGAKKVQTTTHDATSRAAQKIINEVKKVEVRLVTMMEDLSDAYIEFANWDVSRYSKTTSTPISFDKNLLLNKYCSSHMKGKFSALAVPTVDIPIDKQGDYKRILYSVSFSHFKGYFQLCGGINLPKIVIAMSSDGSERKHLVKGRDDLRQDAVMQHVFKVANTLLANSEEPRSLKLRTYKVVPLSQRSGLVEWCEGTIPIGCYLIGVPAQNNFGAHHCYRPNDLLSFECRKKLQTANGKPLKDKLEVYKNICSKFKPVFRHFFYENFIEPARWLQCRTAYCKSVSVSSMVGYVLGLGDRHVQNILIDRTSGEVIHIDLGVAFEQGKCLPTPEMVPFRLTRDIIDGFGSSGVEGTFRRNCERCLRVMRTSIDTISTIVEVLLHDPLHDWMMTSSKAMQVQRQDASNIESEMTASVLNASTVAQLLQNESVNVSVSANRSSLAGRALLRVKEKLRGLESGSVMSVEGQVNLLIQQATDEERLCAMFAGWQPYI